MRRLSTIALCSLLWGCATPATAAATTSPATPAKAQRSGDGSLTVEMMVDLPYVSDVALAPNGKKIAYVLRTPPDMLDGPAGMRSTIWVVPTRGGEGRAYTSPGSSSFAPAWSPNGKKIAFLSRRSGSTKTQVQVVPIDGGEAQPLTDHPTSVHSFSWSPDGKSIAYIADRAPTAQEKKDQQEGRDWHVGDVHGRFHQLWTMELREAKPRAVSPRDLHISQAAWAPSGEELVVQASDRADVDATMMYSQLYVLTIEGQSRSLCTTAGKLGHIEWSPDGKTIAFLGATDIHDPTAGVLFSVPAGGGDPTALTADYEGTGASFQFVGKQQILLLANQGTKTAVHRVSLDGTMSRSAVTDPVCRVVDATRNGQGFVCAGETATHPREVFAGAPNALRRVSHHGREVDDIALGERRIITWTAADGLQIEGVLTLPVGYREGTRYPLAVLPHGGPEGISLDGWNTRAGYPTQLFATHGYVVLEPNYRGSQGRGVEFGKSDQGDLGGKEFTDVLAGIDYLVAEGIVDNDRVGMGGWSYGGYFSGLAATTHSKRFKAAMVGAAITNWMSFTGTSEIEHENSLVHWNLWPYEPKNHALVWDRSPMAHTDGSTTATLVVHGSEDTRVPPSQATELYRALRHAKAPAEVVYYPREGHGLRERAHQIDFASRFVEWFDQHVKG